MLLRRFDESAEHLHRLLELLRKFRVFLISPSLAQMHHAAMNDLQLILKFIIEPLEILRESTQFFWIDNCLGHALRILVVGAIVCIEMDANAENFGVLVYATLGSD